MAQRSNITRPGRPLSVEEVADAVGVYPVDAYEFVQRGLQYTVAQIYGAGKPGRGQGHVTGQQLSEGLREYAQIQWGLMAKAVLASWSITTTYDFGRIVFALVDGGILHKTDDDTIEDFRNVYDFAAFEGSYRIESKL